jgi:hypothetical protein
MAEMEFAVFISYANLDLEAAEALCASLEARQIRCWMAPRDILPGEDWGSSIVRGIESCRLMVLVFSLRAQVSPQVRREAAHAMRRDLSILMFPVDQTAPTGPFGTLAQEYEAAPDLSAPLEVRMVALCERIAAVLAGADSRTARGGTSRLGPVKLSGLARLAWRAVVVLASVRLLLTGLDLVEYLTEHTNFDAVRTYVAFSLPLHFAGMAAMLAVFTTWLSTACTIWLGSPPEVGWRVFTRVLTAPRAPARLVRDLLRAADAPAELIRRASWWWPMWIVTIVLSGVALIAAGCDDPHPLVLITTDFLPTLTLIPAAFLTFWLIRVVEASQSQEPSPGRARQATQGVVTL